jgi:hypothetical protein
MRALGSELSSTIAENWGESNSSGANSGALNPKIDEELARVIAAWPTLSADARAAILAIIDRV